MGVAPVFLLWEGEAGHARRSRVATVQTARLMQPSPVQCNTQHSTAQRGGAPVHTAALEPSSSIILPTVMREGKPCGFMIRSGASPRSLKGMSDCKQQRGQPQREIQIKGEAGGRRHGWVGVVCCTPIYHPSTHPPTLHPLPAPTWLQMDPTTPFCPCLLLNLSPSSGRRVCRTSTLTTQEQSSLLVSSTCRRAGAVQSREVQQERSVCLLAHVSSLVDVKWEQQR